MNRVIIALFFASAALYPTASVSQYTSASDPPSYTYNIIHTYPHDSQAFTQGLVFENGFLYESTGLYGRSSLRKVDPETGQVLKIRMLPQKYFGEGIAIYQDKIIWLTWKSKTGFVYDKEQFDFLHTFTYPTEGWGIAFDGKCLIMSDGTSTLHFLDPETFTEKGSVQVHDGSQPVTRLNELEFIRGQLYANVWQTDRIARIEHCTGRVTGWMDMKGLLKQADMTRPVDVLNGIAFDPGDRRIFVTGKLWPKLFEIEWGLQKTPR